MLKLEPLAQRQTLAPSIAQSWMREFNYLNPERTEEQVLEKLNEHLNVDDLPICYVFLKQNEYIGTASLRSFDISNYTHISPWLGSVVVEPQYRNQGLGTYLVKEIMNQAKLLHPEVWYLWTPNRESFYSKMGWQKIDEATHNSVPGVIMKFDFPDSKNKRHSC